MVHYCTLCHYKIYSDCVQTTKQTKKEIYHTKRDQYFSFPLKAHKPVGHPVQYLKRKKKWFVSLSLLYLHIIL